MLEASRNHAPWGVLLLAHGAPDKLEDIPEFLRNVRQGRPISPESVDNIRRRYSLLGPSPLLRHARRQAEALAGRLGCRVFVGMRNWHPFIADTVKEIAACALERLVVICLAPQNSSTSVGLYRAHLAKALEQVAAPPAIHFVESWHDHPFLIRAFAEKLRAALEKAQRAAAVDVPVIFTAHSVPERTIAAGDPYDRQVRETAAGVAAEAGCRFWQVAYQSQGMTPEPWLGPTVESVIEELADADHRYVVVAPIGFVSDHVEILYDVDIVFRDYAREKGMTLERTESLNDSPLLIEALAALVEEHLRAPTAALRR